MNAIRLHKPDGKPLDAYMCEKCGVIHTLQGAAIGHGDVRYTPEQRLEYAKNQVERCCNYTCLECGKKASQYHNYCRECESVRFNERSRKHEEERFSKATKLTVQEWADRKDLSEVLLYGDDKYYFDGPDEAVASILEDQAEGDDPPEYFWACEAISLPEYLDFDSYVCSRLEDNFHEDAADQITKQQWDELNAFGRKWAEEVGIVSYQPNYKFAVLIPPEMARPAD